MLRLNTTTRKLQVLLSGAITANQLPVMVCYSDKTATSYNGGTQLANTNSTTAVDICAAPAASTVRDIDSINIYNRDTAAATVSVIYNDNATTYVLLKATLAVGDQLIYTHGQGWKVVDSTGSVKSGGGISGLIAASSVTNTPSGNISETTVQAALNGLDTRKQDSTRGADIAASTTLTIPNAGSYFVVTGNTTISAIADSLNGRTVVLKFSGTPQLTHGAGLILPNGANVVAQPGDVAIISNESTGVWRVVSWLPATTPQSSFKNILINGEVTRINQRGVANWAAVSNGAYGYDRWKKVDASNMTQIVEAGNFVPSTTYTLSGSGVTTQQLTSPASGNWTLPNIPIAATELQLEFGVNATPFERRPIGGELLLCQRYFEKGGRTGWVGSSAGAGQGVTAFIGYRTTKRSAATITVPSYALTATTSSAPYSVSPDGFELNGTTTDAALNAYLIAHSWSAEAEL